MPEKRKLIFLIPKKDKKTKEIEKFESKIKDKQNERYTTKPRRQKGRIKAKGINTDRVRARQKNYSDQKQTYTEHKQKDKQAEKETIYH